MYWKKATEKRTKGKNQSVNFETDFDNAIEMERMERRKTISNDIESPLPASGDKEPPKPPEPEPEEPKPMPQPDPKPPEPEPAPEPEPEPVPDTDKPTENDKGNAISYYLLK